MRNFKTRKRRRTRTLRLIKKTHVRAVGCSRFARYRLMVEEAPPSVCPPSLAHFEVAYFEEVEQASRLFVIDASPGWAALTPATQPAHGEAPPSVCPPSLTLR